MSFQKEKTINKPQSNPQNYFHSEVLNYENQAIGI